MIPILIIVILDTGESFPLGMIPIHLSAVVQRGLQSIRIVGSNCGRFCFVTYTLDFGMIIVGIRKYASWAESGF